MVVELEPCPFCETHPMPCYQGMKVFVACPACKAQGPICWDSEDAINRWNNQPALNAIEEMRETIEEMEKAYE